MPAARSARMTAEDAPVPAIKDAARLGKVEVIVNPRSGSVGASAPDEMRAELDARGIDARIHICGEIAFEAMLDEVFGAKPNLVIVLAGDGTVRAVAARAGSDGPMIAPLPGGTMNMLPKAVYGTADWKAALADALEGGEEVGVPGGRVDGEPFYCAAILGAPALWAPAREALREGKLRLGWARAKRALRRAFSGRVRYRLERGPLQRAEALVYITPLISTALTRNDGLEAAVMTTADAREAFRLAATAVFSDWRNDPSVQTRVVKRSSVWARSSIPAILDGETVRLSTNAQISFEPVAFRALAPKAEAVQEAA